MIWENILLALSSLKANKMRSALTMLGIIIGIGAVITIVAIGDSIEYQVADSMAGFGTNSISVGLQERSYSSVYEDMGMSVYIDTGKTMDSDDMFSDEMIDEMLDKFSDDLEYVSINQQVGSAQVRDRESYANVSVVGANFGYMDYTDLEMIAGRTITDDDMERYADVAVVSDKMLGNFGLDPYNAIDTQIKVYYDNSIQIYTIIGVYKHYDNGFVSYASEKDVSTTMYIPLSTSRKDVIEKNHYYFTAITKVGTDIETVAAKIRRHFDDVYETNEDWKASVTTMTSMLDTFNTMMGTITAGITFIAAISLLVGGIGVMNIMLVSVTERTREIGTRKALGARTLHIQMQFLIESVIVTVIGGIIGIIFGVALAALALTVMDMTLTINVGIILISILFSMLVGIFFGLYPASKAAKLDPIEALRYE